MIKRKIKEIVNLKKEDLLTQTVKVVARKNGYGYYRFYFENSFVPIYCNKEQANILDQKDLENLTLLIIEDNYIPPKDYYLSGHLFGADRDFIKLEKENYFERFCSHDILTIY